MKLKEVFEKSVQFFKDKKIDKSTTPDKLEMKSSEAETKALANSPVSACD